MKNTITMICHNRPAYLTRALLSIGGADLTGYSALHIFAEPSDSPEMQNALATPHTHIPETLEVVVHNNPKRQGVDHNGYQAVSFAFEELGADLNVHIEEDIVISPDALRLSRWYGLNAAAFHEPVMCLCLHNHAGEPINERNVHYMRTVYNFSPYGWAATKENWKQWFQPEWFTNRWSPDGKIRFGWDWSINYHSEKTHAVKVMVPAVSRANTIGEFGGVNMTPEQWRSTFADHKML